MGIGMTGGGGTETGVHTDEDANEVEGEGVGEVIG